MQLPLMILLMVAGSGSAARFRRGLWNFWDANDTDTTTNMDYMESTTSSDVDSGRTEVDIRFDRREPRSASTEPTIVSTSASSNSVTDFQAEFRSFENGMKFFIANVRREQLASLSETSVFKEELNRYLSRLPRNESKTVESRDSCYCGGEMQTPCPPRCLYSCYAQEDNYQSMRHYEDCRNWHFYTCWCSSDDRTSCGSSIKKCVTTRTEPVDFVGNCSTSSIEKTGVVNAFEQILNLLLEPLRAFYRQTEAKITFLKEAAFAVDSLSNITTQICQSQTDQICSTEAPHLLAVQKKNYRQLKKNITLELIQAQSRMDEVAESVNFLKEQTIAQINRSIKDFACCLTSFNYTLDGFECSTASIDLPTTPVPPSSRFDAVCPPDVSFLCSNHKCIPRTFVCDLQDHCGDNSDEQVCDGRDAG